MVVGVPDTILNLISALHEGTTARVRIGGDLTDEFLTAYRQHHCQRPSRRDRRRLCVPWQRPACSEDITCCIGLAA